MKNNTHINTVHDAVCHAHSVTRLHEQLHGVFSRTIQGRAPIPHTLHGRALTHKEPLIMRSTSHHEEHAGCINRAWPTILLTWISMRLAHSMQKAATTAQLAAGEPSVS